MFKNNCFNWWSEWILMFCLKLASKNDRIPVLFAAVALIYKMFWPVFQMKKYNQKFWFWTINCPFPFYFFCFSFYFHLADCIYTTLLETLRKSLCILSSAISLTNAIRFSWNQKIGNFNREAAIYYHFAWELEWKSVEWKPAERNKIYNENFSINFAPFSISGFLPFQTQL